LDELESSKGEDEIVSKVFSTLRCTIFTCDRSTSSLGPSRLVVAADMVENADDTESNIDLLRINFPSVAVLLLFDGVVGGVTSTDGDTA